MQVLVAIYSPNPAWSIPAASVEHLRQRFPSIRFSHALDEHQLADMMPYADVAFSSVVTAEAFAVAARLRWIHSPAVGVGGMLFPALRASEVTLTNARGMSAPAVAEHAMGLVFAVWRHIPDAVRAQKAAYWMQEELSRLPALRGRTRGIGGLGAIGQELAQLASGIGMRVIGTRKAAGAPLPPGVSEVFPPEQLDSVLGQSDVVVLAAPLTRDTRGMIGAAQLALMKKTAWLVNVARGKLVDQTAMVAALRAGTIAGAALDVFEHEPLPRTSPLWKLPNVLLTPHIAGFRDNYWEAATDLFAANLERYLAGAPLANVVVKDSGY